MIESEISCRDEIFVVTLNCSHTVERFAQIKTASCTLCRLKYACLVKATKNAALICGSMLKEIKFSTLLYYFLRISNFH